MSWLNKDISERWRTEGKRYASDINEYVRKGMKTGWQEDLKEPEEDQLRSIAADIIKMIRGAWGGTQPGFRSKFCRRLAGWGVCCSG